MCERDKLFSNSKTIISFVEVCFFILWNIFTENMKEISRWYCGKFINKKGLHDEIHKQKMLFIISIDGSRDLFWLTLLAIMVKHSVSIS